MSNKSSKKGLLKVLIVDDESSELELMKIYLEEADPAIRVETTSAPGEALELIKKMPFDCILLDHLMPEMTGLELAKKTRETSRVPIILYTGRGSEEVATQALDYGVDDYVRKNPDPEHFKTLVNRIKRSVEKHRMQELAEARFFPDSQQVKLPEYPKVEVRGNYIYITDENGREELWGREDRKSTALEAAKDIELGLKAIKYGKDFLAKSLNDLMYDLMDQGIPIEYLDNIISQGYGDVKKLLKKLAEAKSFPEAEK